MYLHNTSYNFLPPLHSHRQHEPVCQARSSHRQLHSDVNLSLIECLPVSICRGSLVLHSDLELHLMLLASVDTIFKWTRNGKANGLLEMMNAEVIDGGAVLIFSQSGCIDPSGDILEGLDDINFEETAAASEPSIRPVMIFAWQCVNDESRVVSGFHELENESLLVIREGRIRRAKIESQVRTAEWAFVEGIIMCNLSSGSLYGLDI